MRSGDAAARFGGEEFAAFLLDAELIQGIVAAETNPESDREDRNSALSVRASPPDSTT